MIEDHSDSVRAAIPRVRRAGIGVAAALVLAVGPSWSATLINEIRIDNTSTDTDEYFELIGTPGASLDGLTYLVLGDGAGGCGVIESVTDLSSLSLQADGLLCLRNSLATPTLTGYDGAVALYFENNDNVTHMLVAGFTGSSGNDLDTNDDGVLDVTPWTAILDCVGLDEGTVPNCAGGDEYLYCGNVVGPDGSFVPGHVYRCADTQQWKIGNFSPVGATDTPGEPNHSCASPPPEFQNETRSPCCPQTNQSATVRAMVTRATGANLHHFLNGGSETVLPMTVAMMSGDTTTFEGTLPPRVNDGVRVDYFVKAYNDNPDTTKGFDQGYFVGTVNIGALRVNDSDGVNRYRYYGARVHGDVTVPYGTFSSTNTDYYVQDATGGINVFKFGAHTEQPALGDEITVVGGLDQFSGKLEITDSGPCDSLMVTIHGSGTPPEPKIVSTCTNGESIEGMLVSLYNLVLDAAGDASFVGNRNYDITNCATDTTLMFADSDTNVPGSTIETSYLNLVGIASQYDITPPYDAYFEVMPRSIADITFLAGVGVEDPARRHDFALRASPNPFGSATQVHYRFAAGSRSGPVRVRLHVLDLQGRRVATLVDGLQNPGDHFVMLDERALGEIDPGILFCTLEVGGRILTQKLVWMR